MYKGFLVHITRKEEFYLDLLATCFGREQWTSVILPDNYSNLWDYPALHSAQTLFWFTSTININVKPIPMMPLVGIIIPVFLDEEFAEWLVSPTSASDAIYFYIRSFSQYYDCPIFLLVIHGAEIALPSSYVDIDWWSENVFINLPRRVLETPQFIISECLHGNRDAVPNLIAESFNLDPNDLINNSPSNRLVHPHFPAVQIALENLGCGYDASIRFVEDCLAGLLPTEIPFRIWITVLESGITHYPYDEYKLTIGGDYWKRPKLTQPERTVHAYLEYEGCAFDSMMAFQEPVSIYDFQKRLNSTWRTHIEITPDMTLDDAKEKLNQVVQRVKYGKLEEE